MILLILPEVGFSDQKVGPSVGTGLGSAESLQEKDDAPSSDVLQGSFVASPVCIGILPARSVLASGCLCQHTKASIGGPAELASVFLSISVSCSSCHYNGAAPWPSSHGDPRSLPFSKACLKSAGQVCVQDSNTAYSSMGSGLIAL